MNKDKYYHMTLVMIDDKDVYTDNGAFLYYCSYQGVFRPHKRFLEEVPIIVQPSGKNKVKEIVSGIEFPSLLYVIEFHDDKFAFYDQGDVKRQINAFGVKKQKGISFVNEDSRFALKEATLEEVTEYRMSHNEHWNLELKEKLLKATQREKKYDIKKENVLKRIFKKQS